MATTVTTSNEIRTIFILQGEDGTKTERTIAMPGTGDVDTVNNYYIFRSYVLENMNQFVQKSNFLDETGSDTEEVPSEVLTTVDVQLEFYTVTKQRYNAEP